MPFRLTAALPPSLKMAHTRGKGLSPEAGLLAVARPERRADAVRGQLAQTLQRGPHLWLTATWPLLGTVMLRMVPVEDTAISVPYNPAAAAARCTSGPPKTRYSRSARADGRPWMGESLSHMIRDQSITVLANRTQTSSRAAFRRPSQIICVQKSPQRNRPDSNVAAVGRWQYRSQSVS